MNRSLNPFVRGGPVPPDQFAGRSREISDCVSRIIKGESSAVVGDPHIGKSSFLRYLLHNKESLLREYGTNLEDYVFVYRDLDLVYNETPHSEFWRLALTHAAGDEPATSLQQRLRRFVAKNDFSADSLHSLFDTLGTNKQRVVLLLDEFDYLLGLPRFRESGFFPAIRAFVSTQGLVVILTSRKPLSQLNKAAADYNPHGSPFFNVYEEHTLGLLSPADCRQLLRVDTLFSEEEYSRITLLAGHHPFLLQMAGSYWCDTRSTVSHAEQIRDQVQARFYQQASTFFESLWPALGARERIVLIVFALDFFHGHVGDKLFDLSDAAKQLHHWYPDELRKLTERGILSAAGTSLDCSSMARWLLETKIALASGDDSTYEHWLECNELQLGGLLTRNEIDLLKKVWNSIPKDMLFKLGSVFTGIMKP